MLLPQFPQMVQVPQDEHVLLRLFLFFSVFIDGFFYYLTRITQLVLLVARVVLLLDDLFQHLHLLVVLPFFAFLAFV